LSVHVKHTYRFRFSAAISQVGVGLGGLLGAMGTVGRTANATVANLFSSCKITSVTLWPPATSAALDGITLDWLGAAGYLPDEGWDVTIPDGITMTRAMRVVPPRNSLAVDWLNSGTIPLGTTVFTLTGPEGTILDIDIQGRLANVVGCSNIAVAVAVVGTMYYLSLDGPASNKVQPVGIPSTA